MVLSKLLLAALAVTAHLAKAEVVVGADPLVKYSKCDNAQQIQISEAWFDALEIAGEGKGGSFGDWKGDAEIDYFGPPVLNHPHQRNIQANGKRKELLTNAAALSRPWWFRPTQIKIHARCDDWADKCGNKGPMAYTSQNCPDGGLTCITFCREFFDLPSLRDTLDYARPMKNDDVVKLHMTTYQSRASSMLHELLHLSEVSFPLGHIYDRFIRYKTHEGKDVVTQAIGPYWTKVLARVDLLNRNDTLGFPINADNVVQYALSKYVYKALNVYPYYPIALSKKLGDGDKTQAPGWEIIDNKLQGNATLINDRILSAVDPQPSESINATTAPIHDLMNNNADYFDNVVLNLESFIQHDKYPKMYFTGDRNEIYPTNRPPLTNKSEYVKGDENLHCAVSETLDRGRGNVAVDIAERHIDDACSKLKDKALSPMATGVPLSYQFTNDKDSNALWIGAFWNTGDDDCRVESKISEDECKNQLRTCLNGCQLDTHTQKEGGSRIKNCIIYRIGVEGRTTL
ncbi:uncharacterized protein GIQ15_02276 [Arthroderma uncinatum]|uniref:uncharacterized protein n=1 Tax=Arthroderma uncinatum TaxID=74035 RepID=UPI00144AC201|nr:uncharacterized protein GIQ15_02276 [Arthroderma uncinatum]KAF3482952.1 hypothetical protein GIQ15_02276 [Arthroderma uncinatum]